MLIQMKYFLQKRKMKIRIIYFEVQNSNKWTNFNFSSLSSLQIETSVISAILYVEEKESPSNRSVTKEFFDTLKVKEEDDEFLKNFFNKSKQGEFESKASNISNIIGNENESQFLLNNPNANVKEYGNIKISTFKEWARLSLLDFDKQKTYNESKLKPIKNWITQLKGHLRKSDYKFESKRKTISHSKESLKAMKLLLQNNVSTLLEVKEDLQKWIDLQPIGKIRWSFCLVLIFI